jgi:hypothetical protein
MSPPIPEACSGEWTHHAQVDVWAEAAVQAHLLRAVRSPPLDGIEVEEAKVDWLLDHVVDRLLDLVSARAGQDDPGDVRLVQAQVIGGMRVGVRPQERSDEALPPLIACRLGRRLGRIRRCV